MAMPSPFEAVADGLRVALRVTPKASRNAVTGLAETAGGGRVLKVAVTTVPENGKANEAVIKLLSKAWKVPKTSLTVVAGATDRNKILHVAGDPAALLPRLSALIDDVGSEGGE
ncbi:hypothetical protein VY88_09245 [Azospirillum thiophilum]|uniref:UPF0235 protein AL072_03460 n=1 Tax=Azospirillum thiophilum TaxID=528244 RepID=A0AAC8VV96_9PROT|nr:DUF167 family protein [Azospirillum thiophilum]ALG70129.1 hypothetical protein AL072_03460 [Azospirillum thiophilum]KJR66190.1 hypothetical protein VY88_09245 [Azospirillum thiophilum]